MNNSDQKFSRDGSFAGKVLYGAAFAIFLPLLLIVWASLASHNVGIPPVRSAAAGSVLAIAGLALLVGGIGSIFIFGKGLPMNAYPPARFVVEGAYRFLSHPIYVGFSLTSFGVSIFTGSASGLWLVSPCVVLGCVGLVEGYEREATLNHFKGAKGKPFFRLPPREVGRPAFSDRISTTCLVLSSFLALSIITANAAVHYVTPEALPSAAFPGTFQLAAALVSVPLAAFLSKNSGSLREFTVACLLSSLLTLFLFVVFPFSEVSALSTTSDVWMNFFPTTAYAANWLLIALVILSGRAMGQGEKSLSKFFAYLVAAFVLASGVLFGAYGYMSILVGSLVAGAAANRSKIWGAARALTERVANSWTERHIGPVRIINHGLFAAAGAFVSLTVIGFLVGPRNVPFVLMISFLAIVISAFSAQWIEGSPSLLRPYGWYGGVVGAFLGAFVVYMLGADTWLHIAAFCVGAPFVQSAGRLRCLVQGCCHGRPASPQIGIRYVHHLSRVCRIAGLKGTHLHATQLYSIVCNIVIAALLIRMWLGSASFSLIIGVYYILTGIGRFVEESYRGEPQTPRLAGLRLYQIFAIVSVLGGILVTMVSGTGSAGAIIPSWEAIAGGAVFGVFILFAFGVDFPASERRFARLT